MELVIQEIKKRLAETTVPGKAKVLVLFTGGAIGLEKALLELKTIQNKNVDLFVVCSVAAEKVIGINRIKKELGERISILPVQSLYPARELENTDAVIVPVLTMNSAAKLANLIADTPINTLVIQALMRGLPVIAAVNAADPCDVMRVGKKMNQGTPALKAALQSNLNKLEAYGITLVSVEKLAEETMKILFKEITTTSEMKGKRQLLDAETVKYLVQNGNMTIHVDKGTIVTPLARDVANRLEAEIISDK